MYRRNPCHLLRRYGFGFAHHHWLAGPATRDWQELKMQWLWLRCESGPNQTLCLQTMRSFFGQSLCARRLDWTKEGLCTRQHHLPNPSGRYNVCKYCYAKPYYFARQWKTWDQT
jgi:hypothetical protein